MITNIYIYIIYIALYFYVSSTVKRKNQNKRLPIYIFTLQLHVINSGSSVLGTTNIRTLTIRVPSCGSLVYHFSVVNRVSLLVL